MFVRHSLAQKQQHQQPPTSDRAQQRQWQQRSAAARPSCVAQSQCAAAAAAAAHRPTTSPSHGTGLGRPAAAAAAAALAEQQPGRDTPAADGGAQPAPGRRQRDTPPPRREIRQCRTVFSVCRLLERHAASLGPRSWVTAVVHLSALVGEGQQIPRGCWQQLRSALQTLLGTHTAAPAPASAPAAAPPISEFSGSDLATLLWAAAKLQLSLDAACWRVLLSHAEHVAGGLDARDTALLAWALARLRAPLPLGWLAALLERQQDQAAPADGDASLDHQQQHALAAYSPQSLVLLLYSCVLLRVRLPPAWQSALVPVLMDMAGGRSSSSCQLSGRDLALLLWGFKGLGLRPPVRLLQVLVGAAKPQLSYLSCGELTALLSGIGRLRFLPPGPWLLEAFDQLYWTADQLTLGQLSQVLWALGRLQAVALPAELHDRLLALAALRLQEQLVQLREQQAAAADGDAAALQERRVGLAKQVSQLLVGLLALQQQQQQNTALPLSTSCRAWLLLVVDAAAGGGAALHSSSSSSRQRVPPAHVAASLHAAAKLGVVLPEEACGAVLGLLPALQDSLDLRGAALALWGAVGVGCGPQPVWLAQWLACSTARLDAASVGELHMLLAVCCRLKQLPPDGWWAAAAARLAQLVPRLSGSNCAMLAALLLQLVAVDTSLQEEGGGTAVVVAGDAASLLASLSARVEGLEVEGRVTPSALQRFERARAALQARLSAGGG